MLGLTTGYSQTDTLSTNSDKSIKDTNVDLPSSDSYTEKDTNKTYLSGELTKSATFPRDQRSLNQYLNMKLGGVRPPIKYRMLDQSYRLMVSFVIEKDGSVSNIQIGRRCQVELPSKDLKKIISAFEQMPKWNPGELNGEPKASRYAQTIILK